MNDLINTIANDLSIPKYHSEINEHYVYRVCLSAFGNWCLKIAESKDEIESGSTKHNITIILNELLSEYEKMFPFLNEMFTNIKKDDFALLIRRTYEETGYLLTTDSNKDVLSYRDRTLKIGDSYLYFGLPNQIKFANGLGFYREDEGVDLTYNEIFLRDKLNTKDYIKSKFENDFFDYCCDGNYLYFNPYLKTSLSSAWGEKIVSNYSIAKDENGLYYRVKKDEDKLLIIEEPQITNDDSLISYEYRRLYYALRDYYGNPMEVKVSKLDDFYSQIYIPSFLPNREYYLLLLLGWPTGNIFNRSNFIVRNKTLPFISNILLNLGIKIKGDNHE